MASYFDLITVHDLRPRLGEHAWRLVDCRFDLTQTERGREAYGQDHIPGAVYAHLDEDLAGPVSRSSGRHPLPSVGAFAGTLASWGIANESQVIVYDDAGAAIAARLWWMLRWLGHPRVAVLDGGYAAWKKADYPVSAGNESHARAEFRPRPVSGRVISTEELLASIESGCAPPIVDARDSVRYAGLQEPIDSVAGHVPGAVNYPFSGSLNADGSWRSVEELKKAWGEVLGNGRAWVAMCGSGVTACHLALSAAIAGHPEPRLYVGSWSEWIRDPGRPVAGNSAGAGSGRRRPRRLD